MRPAGSVQKRKASRTFNHLPLEIYLAELFLRVQSSDFGGAFTLAFIMLTLAEPESVPALAHER